MANEDEIIRVGYDGTTFDAGVDKSAAKMAKFRGEVAKTDGVKVGNLAASVRSVAAPVDAAAEKMRKLRQQSEQFEKVASGLGPQLGSLVAVMSKFGKVAGADIGGATWALAGLGVGAGAALAAMGSFLSMTADTVENIDDLAASLDTVTRYRLADQIERLRESRDAIRESGDAWTELKIVLSDAADGPMAQMTRIVANLTTDVATLGDTLSDFGVDWRLFAGAFGRDLMMLENTDRAMNGIAESTRKATAERIRMYEVMREGTDEFGLTFNVAGAVTPPAARVPRAGQRQPSAANAGASMSFNLDDVAFGDSLGTVGAIEAVEAQTAAQADVIASAFLSLAEGYKEETAQRSIYVANIVSDAAEIAAAEQEAAKARIAASDAARDAEIANIEAVNAARLAAVSEAAGYAMQMADAINGIVAAATQIQVDNTEEGTAAHKRALYDQAVAQKAAAMATAAINIPLAVSQSLSSAPFPLNVALGALSGVAATASFIAVSAKPLPKLHTGGLAPDEQIAGGYVRRVAEARYEMTAEGQRRIPYDSVRRANAGLDPAAQNITYILEGRRLTARRFATTNPTVGYANRALASVI